MTPVAAVLFTLFAALVLTFVAAAPLWLEGDEE